MLELSQGGDRLPASGKDLIARGTRGIVVAALFASGPQLKLLDDLFVQPARLRQVSIRSWLELLVSASQVRRCSVTEASTFDCEPPAKTFAA